MKKNTLEEIFYFENKVYQELLRQYESCIEITISDVDYEIKENMIRFINSDLHLAIKSIMTLLNEKTDILKKEFEKEEQHPLIYLNKSGWKSFELVFKSLKRKVIAKR